MTPEEFEEKWPRRFEDHEFAADFAAVIATAREDEREAFRGLLEAAENATAWLTVPGGSVDCAKCLRTKQPVGRSAPMEMAGSLCNDDCEGYRLRPFPGQLWPDETPLDFGYGIPDGLVELHAAAIRARKG